MLAALETARFELMISKEMLKDNPIYQKEIDLSLDKITKAIRKAKGLPEIPKQH